VSFEQLDSNLFNVEPLSAAPLYTHSERLVADSYAAGGAGALAA